MITLAKYSIRRPKVALIVWSVVAVVLMIVGFGASSTLSQPVSTVPGTQSARAQQLTNGQFGQSQLIPILLEGPKAQLDAQGPKLVAALAKRAHTRVLSAWDAGNPSPSLRPKPTAAMMIVAVDRSEQNTVKYDQPQIEKLVSQDVSGPVKAYVTGQPSIDRAEKSASLANLRRNELIAVGIIFLLLLVGLRTPVAAAVVTAVGAISMLAAFGEVALLGHLLKLDPVGAALGTMTGLALGTGFALLIFSRFRREKLRNGEGPGDATTAATRGIETTGPAVLVAGTAVIVALGLVAIVGPTQLMVSLGTGALTCAAFATGGAVVVMPAALVLLGNRIDAFSFAAPAGLTSAWARAVDGGSWVTRHAVYAGFAATVALGLIAVPTLALKSGPPSVTQLPASAKARIAFEEVSRVMGPGWTTPYSLIVVSKGGPITTPALLTRMAAFQNVILHSGGVASVQGPGAIASTSTQLKPFGPGLKHSVAVSDTSKHQLLQLIAGLGQAGSGSVQLRAGLAAAASGASQLHSGSGSAQSGAGLLHAGLAQAKSGSAQLSAGLNQALSGANALKGGSEQALAGITTLDNSLAAGAAGIPQLTSQINASKTSSAGTSSDLSGAQSQAQTASSSLASATAGLNSMRSDPNYAAVAADLSKASAAVDGLSSTINAASKSASASATAASNAAYAASGLAPELKLLENGTAQLVAGIKALHSGNAQLASGISQLSGGGGQLSSGLTQLTAGAGALQSGLGQLTNGTGQLYSGLAGGVGPAGQLATGLGTMKRAVVKSRGQIPSTRDLKTLEKQSPGIFNSGYFVLAAVEGATASQRNAATFTINLTNGGTAGQVVVISKYPAGDPRNQALAKRLAALGAVFATRNNVQVAVGGVGGNLHDLTSVTKSRIPLAITVLALAMWLVLALALRAVLLPAVATLFSLLVAAATFGVLKLLFGGSNPLLGGPGHLDPMTLIGIFTLAFSISIAYAAVLTMRTREALLADGDSEEAVRIGLRQTAAALTGAGIVMIAALIPFITTDMINIRQFGIGVAVAILLNVVIARPVLLPAAEAVLGRSGWWPTTVPGRTGPPAEAGSKGRAPRRAPQAHLPHRRPRTADR